MYILSPASVFAVGRQRPDHKRERERESGGKMFYIWPVPWRFQGCAIARIHARTGDRGARDKVG